MTLPHARRLRFRSLAWVVSACFLVVVGRLVWLHWIDALASGRRHSSGVMFSRRRFVAGGKSGTRRTTCSPCPRMSGTSALTQSHS